MIAIVVASFEFQWWQFNFNVYYYKSVHFQKHKKTSMNITLHTHTLKKRSDLVNVAYFFENLNQSFSLCAVSTNIIVRKNLKFSAVCRSFFMKVLSSSNWFVSFYFLPYIRLDWSLSCYNSSIINNHLSVKMLFVEVLYHMTQALSPDCIKYDHNNELFPCSLEVFVNSLEEMLWEKKKLH